MKQVRNSIADIWGDSASTDSPVRALYKGDDKNYIEAQVAPQILVVAA